MHSGLQQQQQQRAGNSLPADCMTADTDRFAVGFKAACCQAVMPAALTIRDEP